MGLGQEWPAIRVRPDRALLSAVVHRARAFDCGVGVTTGRTAGWSHWSHTVAVLAANVGVSLWVVQYLMLDRILFRTGPKSPETLPAAVGSVDRQPAEWATPKR